MPFQAAASAFGSYLQYQGQTETNTQNRQLAEQNREWATQMSNTAHQREVTDLMAAGLNPMLSGLKTGATTPSVPIATMQNPHAGSAQAANATAMIAAQSDKLKAEAENIRANTRVQLEGQMPQLTASAGHLQASEANIRQEMQGWEDRMKKLIAETTSELARARNISEDTQVKITQKHLNLNELEEKRPKEIAVLVEQARHLARQSRLLGLQVPEAISRAAAAESPAGILRPYVEHHVWPHSAAAAAITGDDKKRGERREAFRLKDLRSNTR